MPTVKRANCARSDREETIPKALPNMRLLNAMKANPSASPATQARTYSLVLAYSYILLAAIGGTFLGLLLYGIISRNVGMAAGGGIMCFSFSIFLHRPGRILLKVLRRRRDSARLHHANDNDRKV